MQDVSGLSLSFIIERTVFLLDRLRNNDAELFVLAEKRGKKEDSNLLNYYNELLDRGKYFVTSQRIKNYFNGFEFKAKSENIIGLQLSVLIAYPIIWTYFV